VRGPSHPDRRIGVVVNPRAKGLARRPGRTAELSAALGESGLLRETRDLEGLRQTVEEMLDAHLDVLVSVGGDGSLHWLLNTAREVLEERGTGSLPPVLPAAAGTIDFVPRKLRARLAPEDAIARLARRESFEVVELDTLDIEGVREGGEGRPWRRQGFALAAGGIGRRFFDALYRLEDRNGIAVLRVVAGASSAFLLARARVPMPASVAEYGLHMFRPTHARVTIDGEPMPVLHHGAIHAGAFDIVLGPLRVFPLAHEPGRMHLQAGDIRPLEIIRSVPDLMRGGLIRSDFLWEMAGREMKVEALGDELLSPVIDGEIYEGWKQLTVRLGAPVRFARLA